jgi:hypothetical protein
MANAIRFVRVQIADLREDLEICMYRASFEMDPVYWNDMERPSRESLDLFKNGISRAFDYILDRWKPIHEVCTVLKHARESCKDYAYVGLNVPYPVAFDIYIVSVCENIIYIFDQNYVGTLTDTMLKNVSKIINFQRKWRHVVTYPDHPICRRRLLHEYEEFGRDLEQLRARYA